MLKSFKLTQIDQWDNVHYTIIKAQAVALLENGALYFYNINATTRTEIIVAVYAPGTFDSVRDVSAVEEVAI